MAECLLVLEDGSGFLVFEDGSGDLLLESCITSECGYELEDGGGVILLESGDELLREDCGTATPLTGGWVEGWLQVDEDDTDIITLTLALWRRRRLRVG